MGYVIAAYAVTLIPLLLYGLRLAREARRLRTGEGSGGLPTPPGRP